MLIALTVALLVTIALSGYMLSERDKTIRFQRGVIKGQKHRIRNQEQLLDGVERAAEVAREVLARPLEATPIYDETKAHEAKVLDFRRDIDGWKGGA